jgi:hypothetical protein
MTLEQLYQNRNLLVFLNGEDWFNNRANEYFKEYVSKFDTVGFDADFYRICWEIDHE